MKHHSTNIARFALTGVALAAGCLWSTQGWALGLGRLSVQSALGETLKAEIEISSITPEETSSLRVRIAPAEAYRAAGVEYNAVLPAAQVQVQRRPDGRMVLRLSSERAVLEPFVDVILEADWAAGRLVREYTMLFDPPGSRPAQAPVAAVASPVITPAAPAPPATAPAQPAPVPTPAIAAAPATPPAGRPAPAAPTRAPSPAVAAGPATAAPGSVDEIRVRNGDTLSGIATRAQRPGVSLDQMLVLLFRANPPAFAGENMNRLKTGSVLSVPPAGVPGMPTTQEAREVIVAQSADFSAYRQRLASGTTARADDEPARQARGQVQAQVNDRKQSATPTPDKLTLSQGGTKASSSEARTHARRQLLRHRQF